MRRAFLTASAPCRTLTWGSPLCCLHPAVYVLVLLLGSGLARAQEAPSWAETGALFAERCVMCHSGEDAPLGLQLDSYGGAMAGSEDGPVLVAGDLAGSELLRRVRGESEPRMPLVGDPLTPEEIALLEAWVGAGLPEGQIVAAEPAPDDDVATDQASGTQPNAVAGLAPSEEPEAPAPESTEAELPGPGEPVTFADVEPIFLRRCVVCHSEANPDGPPEGLRLDTYEHILEGGEEIVLIPGSPQASEMVDYIEGTERPRMPLNGPSLSEDQIRLIRQWIEQGAPDANGVQAPMLAGHELRDDDDDDRDEEEDSGRDHDDDDDDHDRDDNDRGHDDD